MHAAIIFLAVALGDASGGNARIHCPDIFADPGLHGVRAFGGLHGGRAGKRFEHERAVAGSTQRYEILEIVAGGNATSVASLPENGVFRLRELHFLVER